MKNVLVVDDAVFIRNRLKMTLEKYGFKVIGEAENGQVVVEKYMQLKPDLVTMDMTMPEVDGITALKMIRQLDPHARVVMITAMGQEYMVKEAIIAGAIGYVVKPWKDDHLINTLEKIFKRR